MQLGKLDLTPFIVLSITSSMYCTLFILPGQFLLDLFNELCNRVTNINYQDVALFEKFNHWSEQLLQYYLYDMQMTTYQSNNTNKLV